MRASRAILLAAGRGSRLRELTSDRPKCLVELEGRPLVEWQIDALRSAGVEDIVLVTGYRREQLLRFGVRTAHNPHWAETNMVHTLFCAEVEADRPVIVSYSDIVYDPRSAAALAQDERDTVICYDLDWHDLWSRRFEDPLSDAESFRIDETGAVRDIGRTVTDITEIDGQYMGLLRFTPATFAAIRSITDEADRRTLDMTSLLQLLIEAQHPVYGLPVHGKWCEIDDELDLAVAKQLIKERKLALPA